MARVTSPWATLRFRRSKDLKGWVLLGIPQHCYGDVIQSLLEQEAHAVEKYTQEPFVNILLAAPFAVATKLATAFPAPPHCEPLVMNQLRTQVLAAPTERCSNVCRQGRESEIWPGNHLLSGKETFWPAVTTLFESQAPNIEPASIAMGLDEEGFEEDDWDEEPRFNNADALALEAFEDVWETHQALEHCEEPLLPVRTVAHRSPGTKASLSGKQLPDCSDPDRSDLERSDLISCSDPGCSDPGCSGPASPTTSLATFPDSFAAPTSLPSETIQAAASGDVLQAAASAEQPQRRRIELPFERRPEISLQSSWELAAVAPAPVDGLCRPLLEELHDHILLQGVAVWNDWRRVNPHIRPNLRRAYLNNLDLAGANLHDVDLRFAFLFRADLRGSDLSLAWLSGADLIRADLEGACLWGAALDGAYLSHANLVGADLTHADVRGTSWYGAILEYAIMPDGRWFASPR